MTIRTRIVRTAFAAVAALAVAAPSAVAGPLVSSAGSCVDRKFEQPFLPWADVASYVLAPDGGLEAGGAGWALSGGAAVSAGNESFYVGSADDAASLTLPAGSSARTAAMCVGIEHPTLRLFTRTSGTSLGSALRVEVLWEDASGGVHETTIGALSDGASWAPSLTMVIGVNMLTLLPGEHTAVAFRFTPIGTGTWTIDDVYVDPYAKH